MRKFFFLIPAMLLSLAMSAKDVSIIPNAENILRSTVNSCTDDENTITLGVDATYGNIYGNTTSGYVALSHNITIQAAEGANPVIKPEAPMQVGSGATVKFIGIKFDGSSLGGSYDYFIRFNDTNADNALEFENCEFTGIPQPALYLKGGMNGKSLKLTGCTFHDNSSYCIYCPSTSTLGSCIIDSCYFYSNTQMCLYLENTTATALTIIKSTFANNSNSGSHGVVETKSTSGDILVDLCTFYNCPVNSSSYGTVKFVSPAAVVSNSIFVMPSEINQRAIHMPDNNVVNNCLTDNYTYDGDGIRYGIIKNNCIKKNPVFVDAVNADYTLHTASPARGAGTESSDIGDPRWSKEINPSTDFSTDLVLVGADAILAKNIEYTAEYYVKSKNKDDAEHAADHGTATWKFHATKASAVQVTVDVKSGNTSGHIYSAEIFDKTHTSKGTVVQSAASWNDQDKTLVGMIEIPAEGDYTIVLSNSQEWSETIIHGITLSYGGGNATSVPGDLDIANAIHNGTRADGVISFADATTGWAKWNITVEEEAFYDITIGIKNEWEHNITATIYAADGETVIGSATKGNQSSAEKTVGHSFSLGGVYMTPGNYILKITNARDGSDAKIMGLTLNKDGGAIQAMPGTAANSQAWFSNNGTRADGKISFSTYENAWVKWNVKSTSGGTCNVKLYIENTTDLGHEFVVSIYETTEGTPLYSETWNSSYSTTDPIVIDCGSFTFAAGVKYIIKVTNNEFDSEAKVINVVTTYLSGGTVNIPANPVPFADATLSQYASIDGSGYLHFADDDHVWLMADQYAKWNIHANAGVYHFIAHACSPNDYSNIQFRILQNDNEIYSYKPQYTFKKADETITSPDWFLDGDYTLEVSNPANHSHGYLLSLAASAIEDEFIIFDENAEDMSVINANDGVNTKKLVLKRSFVAGMYNTICMPFNEDSNTQLTKIFGEGYDLLEMTGATIEGSVLTLDFATPANKIKYGRPYLIKPTKNVINPVFNAHTVSKSVSHLVQPEASSADASFIGIYTPTVLDQQRDLFVGQNNKVHFPSNSNPLKGLRAYFHINGSGQVNVKAARIVAQGNVVTEINLVEQETTNSQKLIENGQLIIIKNGVRYNAMGIRIQ